MRPLIPILIAFISGIVAGSYIEVDEDTVLVLFAIPILFSILAVSMRWNFIKPALASFFIIGVVFIGASHKDTLPDNHIRNFLSLQSEPFGMRVEGVLDRSPERRLEKSRLYIDSDKIILNDRAIDVSGKVLLTVDSPDTGLSYGDRVRFLARLKEPRNFGNPGEFDYTDYLARRGIYVKGYLDSERWSIKLTEGGWRFWRAIEDLRETAGRFINSEELNNGAILKALLIGQKGEIKRDIRDKFARAGTAHILAISGLHIGIIALVFYGLLYRLLRLSERLMLTFDIRKVAALSMMPPVLFYALLAGFTVPTQRAVIMVTAFVIAILLGRSKDTYNTLAMAAMVILLFSPMAIFDASFQLSFTAVLAIIYITPRLKSLIKRGDEIEYKSEPHSILSWLKDRVLLLFLISLSAAIGTSPIVAYHFQMVPVMGGISNLFVVPLIGFLVVPLGLSSLFFLPFWHGLASILINVADSILELSIWIIGIFAEIPFSAIWTGRASVIEISLIVIVVILFISLKGKKRFRTILLVILLVSLIASYGWRYYRNNYYTDMKIAFISVGQGDSALVEFPYGIRMLIDGGGSYDPEYDIGKMVVAPYLRFRGIKKIDYMVLSHPQADHAGGLGYIIKNFDVREFWWNGSGKLGYLERILRSRSVEIKEKNGLSEPMEINGVKVEFLHPRDTRLDINNSSLVIRLTYRDVNVVFPGDIEEEGEGELLMGGIDIKASILKVPHHGSRTSSTEEFIKAVKPGIAIISIGFNNPFGFPHKEIIDRYRDIGAVVYRTDTEGAVHVKTDGRKIEVERYLYPGLP
jgi:competence protein ComEC